LKLKNKYKTETEKYFLKITLMLDTKCEFWNSNEHLSVFWFSTEKVNHGPACVKMQLTQSLKNDLQFGLECIKSNAEPHVVIIFGTPRCYTEEYFCNLVW